MQHDLNRLRIFYYIYTHNSVSEAAREMNLSQPAVSQHLQKLERELKVQLFTRIHKKLVPTAAGHKLFTTIQPFLSDLPDILQGLRHPADTPYGLLRIGVPYEFGRAYMPEICFSFRQKYPDVRFSIRLGEPVPLLNLLREGEIDFAVIDLALTTMQMTGGPDFYNIIPLIDEELTLICSKHYYDRKIEGNHSYQHLIEQDFISDEHDDLFLKHWFLHHFGKSNIHLNVVLMVESHQANLRCVKLGMGMAATSSHLVWREITGGKIVQINSPTPNAINTISLVELQDRIPTITEKTFLTHIKQTMLEDSMIKRFRINADPTVADSFDSADSFPDLP
ncbi:LysR family transcriptional regulator [Desulfosediminicola sp.]|uniref:LysR family transcriptional regulator n=1 Tax=Desulfosediminicola sp. TaxID=2886825 RepID=UPI003AF2039A